MPNANQKLGYALPKARHLISMHNGMTVRCDGEEWPLDFGQYAQCFNFDFDARFSAMTATEKR